MFFKIRNLLIIFFLYPFFAWGTDELKGYLLDQYEGAVCNSGAPASYYLKKQDPKKREHCQPSRLRVMVQVILEAGFDPY